MKNNGKNGYFFKGLLIGSLAGGLAGILFAPKSGKKMRTDIREKGEDALKASKEFCSDVQDKAKHFLEEVHDRASDVGKKAKRISPWAS